jgi:tetratricopeptide (TPR) repeat protein
MYRQASQIQPDEASYHEWQGRILLYLERPEGALAAYQQALAVSPQIQYYEQIGKLFLQLDHSQEALDLYEKAIQTTTNQIPSLYAGKGQTLLQLTRYDEALVCYQTAIKLSAPDPDPQFYDDLATLYEHLVQPTMSSFQPEVEGRRRARCRFEE